MLLVGEFPFAGWYTNDDGAKGRFPFGGIIAFITDSRLIGKMIDVHGKATIEGHAHPDNIVFRKKYTDGDLINQPPVYYHLRSDPKGSLFVGGYRFLEDKDVDDGDVVIRLLL